MSLMKTFPEKLHEAQSACNSLLCVGLDPDPQKNSKAPFGTVRRPTGRIPL